MHAPRWNIEDTADQYRFDLWGQPYYLIGSDGDLRVLPEPENPEAGTVKLTDLVKWHTSAGGQLPAVFRFPGILRHRIHKIEKAFTSVADKQGYQGSHQLCFPIKTNQRYPVINSIRQCGVGLEVGTKSELLIGAAEVLQGENLPLLCNGYKDAEYIEFALRLGEAGIDVTITLENTKEVEILAETSNRLNIRPRKIGLRMCLETTVESHWADTAGPEGMFGMTRADLIWAVDQLRDANLHDRIVMLHYHLGSSISALPGIALAASEAARIYTDFVNNEGLNLHTIDIGGGLALQYRNAAKSKKQAQENLISGCGAAACPIQALIDKIPDGDGDGESAEASESAAYSLEEYASAVISEFKNECERTRTRHPDIITESGRSVAAQHSMFVFEAFGAPETSNAPTRQSSPGTPEFQNLREITKALPFQSEEAAKLLQIIRLKYNNGLITMRELAEAERLVKRAQNAAGKQAKRKYYYGNLSIFQSLPDVWAIGEMFPIMPIHRLDEEPTVRAVISDITCDSDGRFRYYQTKEGDEIRLHKLDKDDDPYLLGVFDVGAYQETIGDIHNLLSRPSVLSVERDLNPPQKWVFSLESEAEVTSEVIEFVNYKESEVREQITGLFRQAEREQRISPRQAKQSEDLLDHILKTTPYLNLSSENENVEIIKPQRTS